MKPAADAEPLLSVRDLSVSFVTDGGLLHALSGVSFDVPAGRTVALVGESGCGKSVTAQAIMGLISTPPGTIEQGRVLFEGRDLLALSEREMCRIRGDRIAMVFQEPTTSLNPVYAIGTQIVEAIRLHRRLSRAEAKNQAIALLRKMGFPEPETRIDAYPHELSVGMRQRVMIAMGLSCSPSLLILDEPTTALDMTVQAQILDLLIRLKDELAMSVLLIAHDLALVAQIADEIVVLYAGSVVETGPAQAILNAPGHPYTRALLRSLPPEGAAAYRARDRKRPRLPTIEGTLPDMRFPPFGCLFRERCGEAFDRCRQAVPALVSVPARGSVRCFLVEPADVSIRTGGGAR